MDISPELTQWAQAHVFDFIWVLGGGVAFFALLAAYRGATR